MLDQSPLVRQLIPAAFSFFHVATMTNQVTYLCCVAVLLTACGCGKRPVTRQDEQAPIMAKPAVETVAGDTLKSVPGFDDDSRFSGSLNRILGKVEPAADSWDTEVFSEQALAQLKRIGKQITQGYSKQSTDLFASNFRCTPLRPDLARAYSDVTVEVYRQEDAAAPPLSSFATASQSLQPADSNSIGTHVKLVRVQRETDTPNVESLSHFSAIWQLPAGRVQQNAKWKVRWDASSSPPTITSLEVTEFEETRIGVPPFLDATESVLGQNSSWHNQLKLGVDHWRGRLEANYGVDPNGNQGIAIGDVNGDELDDLFVCQQGGLPNRLFLRQRDGTLKDVSSAAGVDWMEMCRSALLVDLDNDGDQDLVMAQGWYLMIMANDGTGRFRVVLQQKSEANLHSTAAADYDNDGDLDLFFCGRNPAREAGRAGGILGMPVPYHDANNGGPNILLRNEGNLKFADVTVASGLDQNNRRYSYAAAWEDFDNDGDQDLYVANDFGRNNLYRNDVDDAGRRKFTDVAATLGVEDISAGMSVTWGDYDNNGRMDIYVSNMFSSAGNRIAYQRQFRSNTSADELGHFQRHARGNSLFENGDRRNPETDGFRDVSLAAGVTMGRWAWGSKFADLNNDGLEDLYVANGFISTEDTGDL